MAESAAFRRGSLTGLNPLRTSRALLVALLGGCASNGAQPAPRALAPGQVFVRVTDAVIDAPADDVLILGQRLVGLQIAPRLYELAPIAAGRYALGTNGRGFLPLHFSIAVRPGRTDTVGIRVRRAAPPCCDLAGDWRLRLSVDEGSMRIFLVPSRLVDVPVRIFAVAGDGGGPAGQHSDLVRRAQGTFDRNALPSPFPVHPGPSSPDSASFSELKAAVFDGDSVGIRFVPDVEHAGIELLGTIRGDTVRGRWEDVAYGSEVFGTFIMTRHLVP